MRITPSFIAQGNVPLAEYPRPQCRRKSYFPLNGAWQYAISSSEERTERFDGAILVPYSPECALSGVRRQLGAKEFLHYEKVFSLPDAFNVGRVLLNVGACDQTARVYVNGSFAGSHEGGYTAFSLDITDFLREGENELRLVVADDAASDVYGRGKQSYARGGIWYTATSGIWQSVWLESVPRAYLASFTLTPDIDSKTLFVKAETIGGEGEVELSAFDGDTLLSSARGKEGETIALNAERCKLWTVEEPELYALKIRFGEDEVESYFGMRKFSLEKRGNYRYFALNGKPVFQNGVLDQGYWLNGLYTPPSNRAMYEELKEVKEAGFNMLRKHIKVEPMLWYYYCDVLGLFVWQDMINGGGAYSRLRINLCPFVDLHIDDTDYRKMKRDNPLSREQYRKEAKEMMNQLYNCVSLCVYTPFNEAWGQFDAVAATEELRQADGTRLYDHASGWQDKGGGDFFSRHIYFRKLRLKNDGRRALALTEFGGYSLPLPGHTFTEKRFGYKKFKDETSLLRAYAALYRREVVPAIRKVGLCAAVYTQLKDVEDEINGVFAADGASKLPEAELKKINADVYAAFAECLPEE